MDLGLKGKRALVTGSSSGIGSAIARVIAAEGATVIVHGRDAERAEQTALAIEAAGGKAIVAIGELTSDAGADAVAAKVTDALGGIDILVNNAGGGSSAGVTRWNEISIADYANTYDINVLSGLRLVERLVPGMVERGWGRIINISSAVARHSMGMMHDYAAAKIAVENVALNLSMNLAGSGVTANTIVPGMILTPGAQGYLDLLRDQHGWPDDMVEVQKRYASEYSPQPVSRLGKPEEIGAAVAFLASPLSNYTTGAVLRVDGGMSRGF